MKLKYLASVALMLFAAPRAGAAERATSLQLYSPAELYSSSLKMEGGRETDGHYVRLVGVGGETHRFAVEGLRQKLDKKPENGFNSAGAFYSYGGETAVNFGGGRNWNDARKVTETSDEKNTQTTTLSHNYGLFGVDAERFSATVEASKREDNDTTKTEIKGFDIGVNVPVRTVSQAILVAAAVPYRSVTFGGHYRAEKTNIKADVETRVGSAITRNTVLDSKSNATQEGVNLRYSNGLLDVFAEGTKQQGDIKEKWGGNGYVLFKGKRFSGGSYVGSNGGLEEVGTIFTINVKQDSAKRHLEQLYALTTKDVALNDFQKELVQESYLKLLAEKSDFFAKASYKQQVSNRGGSAGAIGFKVPVDTVDTRLVIYADNGNLMKRYGAISTTLVGRGWSIDAGYNYNENIGSLSIDRRCTFGFTKAFGSDSASSTSRSRSSARPAKRGTHSNSGDFERLLPPPTSD